jgi:hypothetical protein
MRKEVSEVLDNRASDPIHINNFLKKADSPNKESTSSKL